MPELRELKKKEDPPGPHNKPNKLLVGLLSLLVFALLFVFFRGKKDVPIDSEAPVINAPSSEEFDPTSSELPLEPFEGDNADKAPTGGKIRIDSEDEGPEQTPLAQEEKIVPIPKEELAFFEPLKDQQEETAPSEPKRTPQATLSPKSEVIYTIQLGAFKHKKGADALALRLRKGGYEAYLLTERGQLYKVRVGEYRSREAAKKVADQIRKSERLDSFITRDE